MTDEELEQLSDFLVKGKNFQKFNTIGEAYNSLESKWQSYYVTYARNLKATDKVFKKIAAGKYSSNCLSIEFFSSGKKYHLDFYFVITEGLSIGISQINNKDIRTVTELKSMIKDKWLFDIDEEDGSCSKKYPVQTLYKIEKVKKIIRDFVYQFDKCIDV